MFHYDRSDERALPLTVRLRGGMLSVRSKQLRYIVRGSKGTFGKHGLDVQEAQVKGLTDPQDILKQEFGLEPEDIWGTVEYLDNGGNLQKNM